MSETEVEQALGEAVEEVLEKMFFTGGLEAPPEETAPDEVAVRVEFEGSPPGKLELAISRPAARAIAADFLAEDEAELTEAEAEEVVCELANMICGAMLSRVEGEALFRLAAPRILAEEEGDAGPDTQGVSARHETGLGNGRLRVRVTTDGG